jgi:hypothetical protein
LIQPFCYSVLLRVKCNGIFMSDAALFEEVLEGVACKFGAMVGAESLQSSFALSLGVRKPLLKLRYDFVFGLEQQNPSIAGSIVT